MNKFPGELSRSGQSHRITLNDEQKKWLARWYPFTETKRIAKAMGISQTTLHGFTRELGIKKSEAGMKAIKRRQIAAMVKTNYKNGCYDRKRGKRVSDATMDGVRRRWEEERLGLRENPQKRIRREEPERYKAWMEKRSVERKETIRKEKMRIIYGLERKTNLKVVVLKPFSHSQISHRRSALQRGYLLDMDCSEGNPNRYVIFYDDDTRRSERFERNLIADGFRLERDA